ncbi:hypothetical protein FRX31_032794 [Thalictrum thalictroides]|uniref:Defensin-like protein n=1 Tax=Thalictrum thalictroides TaxID=46969 RepID=A0A7J6UYY1_THATH|nr:hypothetical protein FRX31_032794 [Thalictrum thalictroides]
MKFSTLVSALFVLILLFTFGNISGEAHCTTKHYRLRACDANNCFKLCSDKFGEAVQAVCDNRILCSCVTCRG